MFCGIIWFSNWLFLYEMAYWRKPFWTALGNSFFNTVMLELSVLTIVYTELFIRNLNPKRRKRRSRREATATVQEEKPQHDDFEGFPPLTEVEET